MKKADASFGVELDSISEMLPEVRHHRAWPDHRDTPGCQECFPCAPTFPWAPAGEGRRLPRYHTARRYHTRSLGHPLSPITELRISILGVIQEKSNSCGHGNSRLLSLTAHHLKSVVPGKACNSSWCNGELRGSENEMVTRLKMLKKLVHPCSAGAAIARGS